MRITFVAIVACLLFAAVPVQARTFEDLRIDAAAAPYRTVTAVARWHPLAALTAALRAGVAAWEEAVLTVGEWASIGAGRVELGVYEVTDVADRAAAAFIREAFSRAPPPPTPSEPTPTERPQLPTNAARASWITHLESLLEKNAARP